MSLNRSKAAAIPIVIASILCIIAVSIAVNISIVRVKKQDHAIKPVQPETTDVQAVSKYININKLEENGFCFRGKQLDGVKAYESNKGGVFVPIDVILDNMGIKFKYFSPDDLVEFVINGKKVLIKLGQNSVTVNGYKVNLELPSVAAKNHILVPVELFQYLDGFTADRFSESKTVFLNYFPDLKAAAGKIEILRLVNGTARISDIYGEKQYWSGTGSGETIYPSPDFKKYMVKTQKGIYLVGEENKGKPAAINADTSAAWSADGKYLYWVDWNRKTSYIFDIAASASKKLGDYFFRIKADESSNQKRYANNDGGKLYDYKSGRRYKRVALSSKSFHGEYFFIERRGRTVVKGPAQLSPGRNKILYRKNDGEFYTANTDGTHQNRIGDGNRAMWINNNSILLYTDNGMFLVSHEGRNRIKTDKGWRMLGQTPKGDIFYTDGTTLYCESDGKTSTLFKLSMSCDYVYALSAGGPYIMASGQNDLLYYANRDKVTAICKITELVKGSGGQEGSKWSSITSSPDGSYTVIPGSEEGFLKLVLISNKTGEVRTRILNYLASDSIKTDGIGYKWISNNTLAVYSPERGWLLRIGDNIDIFDWIEEAESTIEGIIAFR